MAGMNPELPSLNAEDQSRTSRPRMQSTVSHEQAVEGFTSPSSDLQSQLHAATRIIHTQLNKTVTARLPLCLPPHALNPIPYYFGILVFGSIYQQFERAITDGLLEDTLGPSPEQDLNRARYLQTLQELSTDGLYRSGKLEYDLQTLHQRLVDQLSTAEAVKLFVALHASITAQVQERTAHIFKHVSERPYLAFAYSWTMYLALFNGGRWILHQLSSADTDFWLEEQHIFATTPNETVAIEGSLNMVSVLSFWRFDTAMAEDPHCEELKTTFKQRFDTASSRLTGQEKAEVVAEAVSLFDLCIQLIEMLDHSMSEVAKSLPQPLQVVSVRVSKQGPKSGVWQTISSTVLKPACEMLARTWTQPLSSKSTVNDC